MRREIQSDYCCDLFSSLRLWKLVKYRENKFFENATQSMNRKSVSSQTQDYIILTNIFLASMYFIEFFYKGNGLVLLNEYPIYVRCRDMIDLEQDLLNLLKIYLDSQTAVQKGRSLRDFSIHFSTSFDLLYFLFFWRDSSKAPPLTILFCLNYRNLWRIVEYPSFNLLPISLRFVVGFLPLSLSSWYSLKILFIYQRRYIVMVVRTLRSFCFLFCLYFIDRPFYYYEQLSPSQPNQSSLKS